MLGFWKNIFWEFGILENYILKIWKNIYKIYVSNLELRFCYELMKKYYVNWSVEGILSNWGVLLGRSNPPPARRLIRALLQKIWKKLRVFGRPTCENAGKPVLFCGKYWGAKGKCKEVQGNEGRK